MHRNTEGSPSSSSSSLFAFKPRQVLLLEHQRRNVMANSKPENPAQLKPEDESILAFSVALWLEHKGFSKVLKRFIAAAQIQDEDWKAKALNLNEIFSKCREICNSAHEDLKIQKKKESYFTDEQVVGTAETNGDPNCKVSEEIGGKKKKKKKNRGDAVVSETGKSSEGTAMNEKMNGSRVNNKENQTEKTSDDHNHNDQKSKASKEINDDGVLDLEVDQSAKKQKDKKKKKNKSVSQSIDSDEKQIHEMPEAPELEHKGTMEDKKSKKISVDAAEDGVNESKKASKKRKRMASDENENQSGQEVAGEESQCKKSKGQDKGKVVLPQIATPAINGHAGKQNKGENLQADQVNSKKISAKNESNDGTIKNNGIDKSSEHKSTSWKRNSSPEPKTVKAFQRVKVEEVKFADERLQDNSYWAKDGAEIGYGAKAQEVLGQVKGRDFRHEKTKKKRGSYRGGQIDLQSHSIKFDYSDEE